DRFSPLRHSARAGAASAFRRLTGRSTAMFLSRHRGRIRASSVLLWLSLLLAITAVTTLSSRRTKVVNAQVPISRTSPIAPPSAASDRYPVPVELRGIDLGKQTAEEAEAKSGGCLSCHQGSHEPHFKPQTVRLGCVDCHGGDPTTLDKRLAH